MTLNATTFINKKVLLCTLGVITLITLSLFLVYSDWTNAPRFSQQDFEGKSLQQSLDAIAKATVDGGAPGVLILVRKDGKETAVTSGVANKSSGQHIEHNSILRMASISKVYTATVILKLAQQGLIDLHAPITAYLPQRVTEDLPNAEQATAYQLLNHTSGIPDYYDLRSYLGQDWTQVIDLERTLPVAKRQEASFAAGKQFEYSNMGYILLGEIAERVTSKPFEVLLNEMIFEPLGFLHTYYNVQYPPNSEIHGYGTILRPWADTYHYWEHSGPDGGLLASASEIAKFLESLVVDEGVLKHIGDIMMRGPVKSARNQEQGLGLMKIMSSSTGDELVGHTGDVFGYQTIAFTIKGTNTSFVAQVNCDCRTLTTSLIRNIYFASK
jgi:D-alanyl-D-alanine carboxypeptidase